ncbi:AEC family transporter [Levilactobacillus acidifarinae]|uniref:Uncharacterized protein n=1 Tax=Levilactobacillus acidifarinae DSM 19394 = JCM 15949 TaxID=1423715 RepID=A0A0R1LHE8_9LACO|nr:AEC family transporter [Levilactobacillus acidifarinae]KRK95197.1 hypothetical protein FD25_GL001580 [Levilactobacillus acidifarinae DSM 19394]GEO70324.1 receptor protein [Levilactobacillus acidifarinae]
MIGTLIFALLPIVVTIALGMYAAKIGDFGEKDSQKLTHLVLHYALPMNIFAGIWGTPRKVIIADIPLACWIVVGMLGSYLLVWFFLKKVRHVDESISVLRALSIADPSVPFIGSAILPLLFAESIASIDIGISTLMINVVLLPIIFAQMASISGEHVTFGARVKQTLKKPLVFSALSAFILSMLGLQIPEQLVNTFTVLGKSSGGLAMFATGIILYSRDLKLTRQITINTLAKNIVVPCVIWGLMVLLRMPDDVIRVAVVTLAIPTATMPTSLAIKYKSGEAEMASTQFYTTIFAVVSLSFFMLIL